MIADIVQLSRWQYKYAYNSISCNRIRYFRLYDVCGCFCMLFIYRQLMADLSTSPFSKLKSVMYDKNSDC